MINSLTNNKYNLLLNHIINSPKDEIFTLEETKKLSDSLKLDSDNLQLLIQSLTHIFKQASKVILKPTVLQEQLINDMKFDADKAEDFVKTWTKHTNDEFDLEKSYKLDDVSWELAIQTASSFGNKQKIPTARIQMGLSGPSDKSENLILEMDKDELLQFYNTLEKIQTKLDSL